MAACIKPSEKAKRAREIVLSAYHDIQRAHVYFGRKFDSLFEQGDGKEVVVEFVKIYNEDERLQNAVTWLNHWIGIESWKKTYNDVMNKEKRSNLFTFDND